MQECPYPFDEADVRQMPTRSVQILSRVGRSYPTQLDETDTDDPDSGRWITQAVDKKNYAQVSDRKPVHRWRKVVQCVVVVDQIVFVE
jgi:hypothetical protein